MLKTTCLLIAISLITFSCGNYNNKPISDQGPKITASKTIHIDETIAKSQGGIGFCWSYTIVGMLESLELKRGVELDLSEEHLGFYRLLEQLENAIDSENPLQVLSELNEGNVPWNAMKLAEKVGLVPESIFNIKYPSSGVELKLKQFFQEKFASAEEIEKYKNNKDLLFSDLATIFGKRPLKPTEKFIFEGKKYTPVSFLKTRLGFKRDDYLQVTMDQKKDRASFNIGFHYLKVALMNKISVPIAVAVFEKVEGGTWDTTECSKSEYGCEIAGGHAMLAVDFQTTGGRFGQMPMDEVMKIFNNDLEAIIVKNSWGYKGVTQEGETPQSDNDKLAGYNILTRSFLDEAFRQRAIRIVIPKSIFKDGITSNAFFGAGIRTEIKTSPFAQINKKAVFEGVVLDFPISEEFSNTEFSWELKKNDGTIIYAQNNGSNILNYTFNESGVYDATFKVSVNEFEKIITRQVWVMGEKNNLINRNSVLGTSNENLIDWNSKTIIYDTGMPQTVPDLNKYITTLPSVDFQQGGRVLIEFTKNINDGLPVDLEVSTDNGRTYHEVDCGFTKKGSTAYKMSCLYPEYKNGYSKEEKTNTAKFRLMAKQMPQQEYKIKGISTISNLLISAAGGVVQKSEKPVYVTSRYPKNTTYKHFSTVNVENEFKGIFSADTEKVNAYIGEHLIQTFDIAERHVNEKSQRTSPEVMVTLNIAVKKAGFYPIKLIGIKNGIETSYVSYHFLVGKTFKITPETPWKMDLSTEMPFIINFEGWFPSKYGVGLGNYPNPVGNDISATAIINLDLKDSKQTFVDLKYYQGLETDYDFVFIMASKDGGTTFETLETITGMNKGLVEKNIDLSKFSGEENVILRFEGITDTGERSFFFIINSMTIR